MHQAQLDVAGHCNSSQNALDAGGAENTSLVSGRNASGSDAGSVFADVVLSDQKKEVCSGIYYYYSKLKRKLFNQVY